jgi:hypothetical protein
MGMFAGSGKLYRDEGNAISRSEFANGYALYAFDLSPDLAEEGHFNLARQGGVRLSLNLGPLYQIQLPLWPMPNLRT